MHRKILMGGLFFSFLSIVFGAFGAHALKSFIQPDRLVIFETGVRYQFMHGAGLIMLALYASQHNNTVVMQKAIAWASIFFIVGIFCFCGSLYLLALQSILQLECISIVGPITPIGGLFFILGWLSWIRVVWLNKVDK
jgi:uncharacterized membrane protein YgdD (TMEM256/DUF423 family)